MSRPVLVDLPLERFLQPTSDNTSLQISRTGLKRSRSPSFASSIFTPAKRRILEQEGLFPPAQSRPYSNTSTRSPRLHRSGLLHASDSSKGTSSPAVVGLSDDALPLPPCPPHALVPPLPCESRRISPRLSASPQSNLPNPSPNNTTPTGRTRTSPRRTRSQTFTPTHAPPSQRVRPTPTTSTSTTTTPSPTTPRAITMVPREMPPPPDRRSVHYPGFDVHQDTHLALPRTRSKARARAEAARVGELEGDAAKENVRPVPTTSAPSPSNGKVKGNGKGDVPPRRSARLRRNSNGGGCAPSSQKVLVVPADARVHGRRRRGTLHDSALPF